MNVIDLLLQVECYVGLRKAIGYTVRSEEKLLKDFVAFLIPGTTHGPIRAQTAVDWACTPSPGRGPAGQASRLKVVRGFLSHCVQRQLFLRIGDNYFSRSTTIIF